MNIDLSIEHIFREHRQQVLASTIGLIGDFDLAEDAVQEAFLAAASQWPTKGLPDNPVAWLISSARFKAIDGIRRLQTRRKLEPELKQRIELLQSTHETISEREIADDQLRLILMCCHPALDTHIKVALTLREVCGLTTEEIASAFLTPVATMAQRIVRGKAKIRAARIPFAIPTEEALPQRIESVLTVCYLVFNEGYSASSGANHLRTNLCDEAIRLGRLIAELHPDAETFGLAALMLLHDSRRTSRVDTNGDLVLLQDQNRSLWNQSRISEGQSWLKRALKAEPIGTYTIQAAIAEKHAAAASFAETDWAAIVSWYDTLLLAMPSPVVELNRAVALAERDGPEIALSLIEALQETLADYHLFHASIADLYRRCGRWNDAATAYQCALKLAHQDPERRFLNNRLNEMRTAITK